MNKHEDQAVARPKEAKQRFEKDARREGSFAGRRWVDNHAQFEQADRLLEGDALPKTHEELTAFLRDGGNGVTTEQVAPGVDRRILASDLFVEAFVEAAIDALVDEIFEAAENDRDKADSE